VQTEELRSGGSYFSQNDLRLHFGLDQAKHVDLWSVRWLSGQVDQFRNLDANRLYVLEEGGKILKSVAIITGRVRDVYFVSHNEQPTWPAVRSASAVSSIGTLSTIARSSVHPNRLLAIFFEASRLELL
jgi:hypothetical protein